MLGKKPPSNSVCNVWILEAEKLAKIPHIERRGWHSLKRLYATLAQGMVGWDKQSGTTQQTLHTHYVQDFMDPKVQLARDLEEKL